MQRTSSDDNTFIGYRAGRDGTSGYNNTYVGSNAGSGHSGNFCTFIGSGAGSNSASNYFNTIIGASAGSNLTSGSINVFVGNTAGLNTTSGEHNVFTGGKAGYNNTSGSRNIFIGYEAGMNSSAANDNVFTGYQSGQNNSGFGNSFYGNQSGVNNTAGNNNSFFGYLSGNQNINGYGNTYVGNQSGANDGYDNTCIGLLSGSSSSLNGTTTLGSHAGATSNSTVAVGFYAQVYGLSSTALGANAIAHSNYSNALGSYSSVICDNCTSIGTGSNEGFVHNVGIGTSNPQHQLHVTTNDAAKLGGGSWVVISDRRLKKDIKPFEDGLDVLKQINPVSFRYNGKAEVTDTKSEFVGIIAQDMQEVAPYMISEFNFTDSLKNKEKYLQYDGNALIYILVNSVKEQQAKIEELELKLSKASLNGTNVKPLLPNKTGSINSHIKTGAELFQNIPNPFTESTNIRYHLAGATSSAAILILDMNGRLIKTHLLNIQNADGELRINAGELNPGMFYYTLIIDNKEVDTKRMIITGN